MKIIAFIIIVLFSFPLLSQSITVSGKVIDISTNEPLIGANVTVKGTTNGTVTDFNGNYNIIVENPEAILVFSYISYLKKEIVLDEQTEINVKLEEDVQQLEEAVVVGYGSQKKENLTGAIENVELKDVQERTLTNAGQILQGKVSGVQITQNSGQPGQDNTTIRIRGVSSINNNNEPLVIIDGIQGSLEDINPNDIETMTVLKDASAAAIYGSRASAGVLLIKTKNRKDRLSVSYTSTVSFQTPTALPDPLNSATYADRLNEARINTGFPARYTEEEIALFASGTDPRYPNTNWYDQYFSNAWMHNHYVNVGGSSDQFRYTMSAGYLGQDGILLGTSSNKTTYRSNLSANLFDDKLKLTAIISGYNKNEEELSSSTPTVLTALATASPTSIVKAVDSSGSDEGLYGYGARYLAIYEAGGSTTRDRDNLKYQFEASLEPLPGLEASFLYGKNTTNYIYQRLVSSVNLAGNVFDDAGSVTRSQLNKITSLNIRDQATATIKYHKRTTNHNFTALAGGESLKESYTIDEGEIYDLSANESVFSLGDPSTLSLTTEARVRTILSLFGRINYIYKNRYLFEANVRRDGSSRFTKGSKFGTFPSFSAGWIVSEEPFFKADAVKSLKIRASWGLLGNEYIGSFYPQYSKLTANQDYSFGGNIVPGTAITELAANNVTWEKVEQINIGADATLFKNFDVNLNFFRKKSFDNLVTITVPKSLGIDDDPFQNIGTMLNQGIEFGTEYRSNPNKEFIYSIGGNVSYITNEVTDLGPLDYVYHTNFVSGYQPDPTTIRSQVGSPFASYYGYIADGIYQVSDFTWQNDSDPNIDPSNRLYTLKEGHADPSGLFSRVAPGDIRFKDVNNDGVINTDDKQIIGNSQPRWTYALTFNASYKNFDFSLLAQGVGKTDAYLTGALVSPFWNGTGNISQDLADNRWTYDNPSETYQRLHVDAQRSNLISSYYIQDASYLRIKNVVLGYSFPKDLLKKANLNYLRVFLSVENLLTFSNFSGFDPERTYNKITGDFHPQVQIYSFGLNLRL